jgi:GNAT superfamily N-acetyltransferase
MERREYPGPDALRSMQELAARVSPTTGYHHIGDLTWNWCLCLDRNDRPTAVWRDGDEVTAWAWLELPDELLLQVAPAYPELADDVLAWAEKRAGRPLAVEVAETEPHLAAALEHRGYTRIADGPFMLSLRRDLTDLPAVPTLPPSYTIGQGAADVAGRAAAHRAAFGSTQLTTWRQARMMETWPYRSEYDLVVRSPAGDTVAYCQGWYDEENGIGEFEPVGTHPDHRRLGLAGAVSTAVLHAFAAAGGRRAVVYCRGDAAYPVPKLLYQSIGFRAFTRTWHYTR